MRRPFFALPLLLALVVGALAGPSTAATATAADAVGSASGTVTYPGGDVTATRVQIHRRDADGWRRLSSVPVTPDGRWAINLAPGAYRFGFAGTGDNAVTSFWGADDFEGATVVDLKDGDRLRDIDGMVQTGGSVYYRPTTSITGHRLQLRLFREAADGSWVPTAHGIRFDDGPGRLRGVPAGTYRAEITPVRHGSGTPAAAVTGPAFFHPAAASAALGDQVQVVPREETRLDGLVVAPERIVPVEAPVIDPLDDGRTYAATAGRWPAGVSVVEQRWYRTDFALVLHPVEPSGPARTLTASRDLAGRSLVVRTTVESPGRARSYHWSMPQTITTPFVHTPSLSVRDVAADAFAEPVLAGGWSGAAKPDLHRTWTLDSQLLPNDDWTSLPIKRTWTGKRVGLRVVATAGNFRSVLTASATVRLATRRVDSPPVLQDVQVGRLPRLDAHPELMWSPAPDPAGAKDYRITSGWLLDGRAIKRPGALPPAYVGHRLQVRYTLAQTGYPTVTATSRPVTVRPAAYRRLHRITLSRSNPKVGQRIRVEGVSSWSPRPTRIRYSWYLDGKLFKRSRSSYLTLKPAMRGKSLRARVVGKRAGYPTITRDTSRRRVVVR